MEIITRCPNCKSVGMGVYGLVRGAPEFTFGVEYGIPQPTGRFADIPILEPGEPITYEDIQQAPAVCGSCREQAPLIEYCYYRPDHDYEILSIVRTVLKQAGYDDLANAIVDVVIENDDLPVTHDAVLRCQTCGVVIPTGEFCSSECERDWKNNGNE